MATYLEIYNLRVGEAGEELKARIAVAIARAAVDVLAESVNAANHTARLAWAKASLADVAVMSEKMLWGVFANTTIASKGKLSDDNDLQFVVNSLIDTYSALV